MIGLGYYGTVTPPVIRRNVLENPAWYTAYTPYQPEISQGRLEALLNFQTVVSDLTGAADRRRLAARRGDRRRRGDDAHAPHRQAPSGRGPARRPRGLPADPRGAADPGRAAGPRRRRRRPGPGRHAAGTAQRGWRTRRSSACSCSTPTAAGEVRDLAALVDAAHEPRRAGHGRRRPARADPARAAGGVGRRHRRRHRASASACRWASAARTPGYMAVRAGLERPLPGRLVGVSVDAAGAPAYRLALQTREQHIRREKATCNICTAQVLLAVMAAHVRRLPRPRRAARPSRGGCTATRRRAGGGAARRRRRRAHDRAVFDTVRVRVPGRAASVVGGGAAARASTCWLVDDDTVGAQQRRDDERCVTSRRSAAAFGVAPPARTPASTPRPQRPDALAWDADLAGTRPT